MNKKLLLSLITTVTIFAQNNTTVQNETITEKNLSKKSDDALKSNIEKMIEKEKKYKEEQKFYMGKDYNLTEHEVDKKTVDKVPSIEPEYDFDITDLYAD
jgi:hypothetical protein